MYCLPTDWNVIAQKLDFSLRTCMKLWWKEDCGMWITSFSISQYIMLAEWDFFWERTFTTTYNYDSFHYFCWDGELVLALDLHKMWHDWKITIVRWLLLRLIMFMIWQLCASFEFWVMNEMEECKFHGIFKWHDHVRYWWLIFLQLRW